MAAYCPFDICTIGLRTDGHEILDAANCALFKEKG